MPIRTSRKTGLSATSRRTEYPGSGDLLCRKASTSRKFAYSYTHPFRFEAIDLTASPVSKLSGVTAFGPRRARKKTLPDAPYTATVMWAPSYYVVKHTARVLSAEEFRWHVTTQPENFFVRCRLRYAPSNGPSMGEGAQLGLDVRRIGKVQRSGKR